MENKPIPQVLTNDEKKAAEAAFARRPFNPAWSQQARVVYEGIVRSLPSVPERAANFSEREGGAADSSMKEGSGSLEPRESREEEPAGPIMNGPAPTTITFQQAIEAGVLIDVSPAARQIGLLFPVRITKPLWEVGIAPAGMSEEERAARLRDVLMAFRLRLTTQPTMSPLIDFPALLALPPNEIPQPIPLLALVQPDEQQRAIVTLLLPSEVSTGVPPLN